MKNKKLITILTVVIVLAAVVCGTIFAFRYVSNKNSEKYITDSQVGITVDSWLKISSLGEKDGRLSVTVENISDKSIEYALLTVMHGEEKLSFNISVLPAGEKAFLLCNEEAGLDKKEGYVGWSISDRLDFEKELSLYEETFRLTVADGSIGIKNITDNNIENTFYIVYKENADGIINGSQSRRIKLSGLDKGAETFIKADGFLKDTHEIIFIDYDN